MGPAALAQVLRPLTGLSVAGDPNLIAGLSDDAAVLRLSDERALVLTVDFFPPVVDDPYTYGAIAAANAMSDVYAMGGEVALALNVAAFPEDLPLEIISEVLRGGAETVRDAGGSVVGGHTTLDREPKYGLCVLGFVHPDAVLTKGGARPGDSLYLTKALGTGIVLTQAKSGKADPRHLDATIESMRKLNRVASRLAAEHGAHAVTDVTGFGLLGHALEVAAASGVAIEIDPGAVPVLPGALEYARAGVTTGGTARNRAHVEPIVDLHAIDAAVAEVLLDPQTSGGLLIAVGNSEAERLEQAFARAALPLVRIGRVHEGSGLRLVD